MIFTADIVLPITSPPIKNGAVLVRDGRIVEFGSRDAIIARNGDSEVRTFDNAILMPGLVNLHGHFECASFDFLAEPAEFPSWLGRIIKAGREMSRDDWLRAARLGVKKSLEAGITCSADITRSGAGLQVAAEAGTPALIYLEFVGVDDSNLAESLVDLLERIKSSEIFAQGHGLKIGLSPHSAYTLTSSALKLCAEIASEYGLPLSIHLAETQAEVQLICDVSGPLAFVIGERLKLEVIKAGGSGKTPAQFLNDFGLIRDSLVAAHGVWLNDEDIELLKEKGTAIALCPTSNELLRVGEAPVAKFVEQGLSFAFGTDSLASNPTFDLFVEIRKVQELYLKQGGAPAGLTAKSLIERATIDAARILGFDDILGSIEPGKRADFVIIRADSKVIEDPYTYLVESSTKTLVEHSILGGTVVFSA